MNPTITRTPGSYAVAVTAPYNENFVRSVKRWLPLRTYKWDKYRRVWRFKAEQVDTVIKLLSLHYGGYEWQEESTQWIPVEERLPEKHTDVLCFGEYGVQIAFLADHLFDADKLVWIGYGHGVTHWQPLPEPLEVAHGQAS